MKYPIEIKNHTTQLENTAKTHTKNQCPPVKSTRIRHEALIIFEFTSGVGG